MGCGDERDSLPESYHYQQVCKLRTVARGVGCEGSGHISRVHEQRRCANCCVRMAHTGGTIILPRCYFAGRRLTEKQFSSALVPQRLAAASPCPETPPVPFYLTGLGIAQLPRFLGTLRHTPYRQWPHQLSSRGLSGTSIDKLGGNLLASSMSTAVMWPRSSRTKFLGQMKEYERNYGLLCELVDMISLFPDRKEPSKGSTRCHHGISADLRYTAYFARATAGCYVISTSSFGRGVTPCNHQASCGEIYSCSGWWRART